VVCTGGGGIGEVGSSLETGSTLFAKASVFEAEVARGFVPDSSGQREATTEPCVFASDAFSRWSFSTLAVSAGVAGITASVRLGASIRVCGKSSARASAIDRVTVSCRGKTGFSDEAELCDATREGLSFPTRTYQQWRLVVRSTR
jgi:hypothetical protein